MLASLQKKDIAANTTHLAILLKLSRTIIEKVTLNNSKLSWILFIFKFFLFEDFCLEDFTRSREDKTIWSECPRYSILLRVQLLPLRLSLPLVIWGEHG